MPIYWSEGKVKAITSYNKRNKWVTNLAKKLSDKKRKRVYYVQT